MELWQSALLRDILQTMKDQDDAIGNLPHWMKLCGVFSAPCAVLLAVRIIWEKTVWTWSRGPQMVGFSLWHIHPLVATIGLLSLWALMAWSAAAFAFVALRRKRVTPFEIAMFISALFVIVAMAIPDTFFAHGR